MCKLSPLLPVGRPIAGSHPPRLCVMSSLDSDEQQEREARPMSVGTFLKLPASLTGDFNWTPFHEIPVVPWRDWFVGVSATATKTPWVQAGVHDLARDRRRSSKSVVQCRYVATTALLRSPPRRQGSPDVAPSQYPHFLARKNARGTGCWSTERDSVPAALDTSKSKVGNVIRKEKHESPHARARWHGVSNRRGSLTRRQMSVQSWVRAIHGDSDRCHPAERARLPAMRVPLN